MSKWAKILIISTLVLVLSACGANNFKAFKEMGVNDKNIPEYKINSEIIDQNTPSLIITALETKDLDENGVKQVMADYFNKKLTENSSSIKQITIFVKDRKKTYTAYYLKDEQAFNAVIPDQEKPQKYPAIIYITPQPE